MPSSRWGDRPQPAGQPLHIGGRGDPEGSHRGFLGPNGGFTRLERARDGRADHGIRDYLLRDPAEGLLALSRKTVHEPVFAVTQSHRGGG